MNNAHHNKSLLMDNCRHINTMCVCVIWCQMLPKLCLNSRLKIKTCIVIAHVEVTIHTCKETSNMLLIVFLGNEVHNLEDLTLPTFNMGHNIL